jgi:hypothetical protein
MKRLLSLVPLLAWASTVSGATITFSYNGNVNGLSIGESVNSGASFTEYQSGQLPIRVISTTGFAGPVPVDFMSFCIEPLQGISGGTYTYAINPLQNAPNSPGPMGTIKADLLRELFGRYYSTFQQTLTPQTAAAIQIAIWEIVQETSGPFNVSTGVIRYQSAAHNDVIILANTMLSSLNGTGPMLSNLYSLGGPNNQDLAFRSETPVPEPSTVALMAIGLAWGFRATRRRR